MRRGPLECTPGLIPNLGELWGCIGGSCGVHPGAMDAAGDELARRLALFSLAADLGPIALADLATGAAGDVEGAIGVEGDAVGVADVLLQAEASDLSPSLCRLAALHGVLAKGVRNFYAQFRVCSNASSPVSTRLTGSRLPRRRTDGTQSGVYQLQPPGRGVSPGVSGIPQTLGR